MQMVTSGCAAWSSFATNALFHITYRPPVLFAEEERTTSHDGTTHSRRPAERKWVARGVVICPRADIRRVAAYGLESTAVGRRRRPLTVCNRSTSLTFRRCPIE